MAIPSKGSRKILVDGIEYIWLVRHKPTYTQECQNGAMYAAVQLKSKAGSVLQIEFPWQRPDSLMSNDENSVNPKHVEEAILGAINSGWEAHKNGGTFNYMYASN